MYEVCELRKNVMGSPELTSSEVRPLSGLFIIGCSDEDESFPALDIVVQGNNGAIHKNSEREEGRDAGRY